MVCGLEGSEGRFAGGGGGGGRFPNVTDPDGFPMPCWFKAAILWERVVNCGSSVSAMVAAFFPSVYNMQSFAGRASDLGDAKWRGQVCSRESECVLTKDCDVHHGEWKEEGSFKTPWQDLIMTKIDVGTMLRL